MVGSTTGVPTYPKQFSHGSSAPGTTWTMLTTSPTARGRAPPAGAPAHDSVTKEHVAVAGSTATATRERRVQGDPGQEDLPDSGSRTARRARSPSSGCPSSSTYSRPVVGSTTAATARAGQLEDAGLLVGGCVDDRDQLSARTGPSRVQDAGVRVGDDLRVQARHLPGQVDLVGDLSRCRVDGRHEVGAGARACLSAAPAAGVTNTSPTIGSTATPVATPSTGTVPVISTAASRVRGDTDVLRGWRAGAALPRVRADADSRCCRPTTVLLASGHQQDGTDQHDGRPARRLPASPRCLQRAGGRGGTPPVGELVPEPRAGPGSADAGLGGRSPRAAHASDWAATSSTNSTRARLTSARCRSQAGSRYPTAAGAPRPPAAT